MSNTPLRGLKNTVSKGKRKEKEKEEKKRNDARLLRDYDLYRAVKPRKKYSYRSDYFEIDDTFATILTIMHHQGADDNLGYFWGINIIPRDIDNDVSVRRLEHVSRMSESWIGQNQGRAEGLLSNQQNESGVDGDMSTKHQLNKQQQQLLEIAQDISTGAAYLKVAMRLLIKAPTLDKLDETVRKINRQYKDRFDTIYAAPYIGEQKNELANTFKRLEFKMGKNFMFTSSQYAGSYSLVTRGVEDPTGEYIGQMEGDVNNSAVLMDLDNYDGSVVVAGALEAQTLSNWDFQGQRGSDVWGAKLGMCALLKNQKVIHLILNRAKISDLGADLSDITSNVNMTQGDINPFEMFGDEEYELSIFPAHLEKMYLMVEQLQPMTDNQRARIKGTLQEVLNNFYVDKRMWVRNAQKNRDALRLVGLQHDEIPKLPEFQAYLDMEYQAQVQSPNKDPEVMNAYGFLATAFRDMMDSNGDLFNTTTSDIIDRAAVSNRVIYDFSALLNRGRGVMMAQFVNALGYAVGSLGEGDLVVLHGAEHLASGIKSYVKDQFDQLQDHKVRIVYTYNTVDRMIRDKTFNEFEDANYTLLGGMNKSTINLYEKTLEQEVPVTLKSLLEHKERYRWYLRRGFDNIVFASDIQMGFDTGN